MIAITTSYLKTPRACTFVTSPVLDVGFTDLVTMASKACGTVHARIARSATVGTAVEIHAEDYSKIDAFKAALLQGQAGSEFVEVESEIIKTAVAKAIRLHFGDAQVNRLYLLRIQDDYFLSDNGKILTIRQSDL